VHGSKVHGSNMSSFVSAPAIAGAVVAAYSAETGFPSVIENFLSSQVPAVALSRFFCILFYELGGRGWSYSPNPIRSIR